MKYEIRFTHQFKKAYKLCMRRGLKMSSLEKVIRLLAETGELPPPLTIGLISYLVSSHTSGSVMSNLIGY